MLLDEPFGALDAKVRKDLRRWLRSLHDELHVTSVLVTHDQEEALEVADRIVVMSHGRIEQVGSPDDVYERPSTAFVHDFIGESVALPIIVQDGAVKLGGRSLSLGAQDVPSGNARLFMRPHDIELGDPGTAPLAGKVVAVRRFGQSHRVDLAVDISGETTIVEAAVVNGQNPRVGEEIGIQPTRYRVFAA